MRFLILLAITVTGVFAQTGTLTGRVLDESGARVPGATVRVGTRTATSAADGLYAVPGLITGEYDVRVAAPQLVLDAPVKVTIRAGVNELDLRLRVAATEQKVTVLESAAVVSTDASTNASATVISGADLDSLSDDPEDLSADLQALAGPSAGPGGGASIFVDGFSGGQLPPKNSIREIRINQNPFSPEFDRLGLGRIEIFTKPGTDKFHGTVTYNYGADWWNSRNPYSASKVPFLLQETENSFSGRLNRRSSFTLDFERNAVDNGQVANGVQLDAALQPVPFSSVVKALQRHWHVGPHVDYQLNQNNTLTARYSWTRAEIGDGGLGSFDLPSRAAHILYNFQTLQMSETSIHGTKVNEIRYQFFRETNATQAIAVAPAIVVQGAFASGGANSPFSGYTQNSHELQNYTSVLKGANFWRFGMRLRSRMADNVSRQNFNGLWTFTSLDDFRRGKPAQLTIAAGNPEVNVNTTDVAVFAGDEWRVRPNLTLSYGARLESQTRVNDHFSFAPRVALAWAPGGRAKKQAKTVIRAGAGLFYDRFQLGSLAQVARFDGVTQQQFVLTNPDSYPRLPLVSSLAPGTQSIQKLDAGYRSPYVVQSALTIDRQLPHNITLAATWTNTHGVHVFRTLALNAPLQGTRALPYPGQGPLFLLTASGLFNQNQFLVNVNAKVNPAVSLLGYYVLNQARSNADGLGSMPANAYDYTGEYGRASTDARHRMMFGGTVNTRWGVRFNPLLTAQTGGPFNITSGVDSFGTTVFNARPSVAGNAGLPGVVRTSYGLLNPFPAAGETVLARNSGNGPGQIMVNLRMTRTWGLGREVGSSGAASGRRGDSGGQAAGPMLAAPTRPVFSNATTARRFNFQVGMSIRNLLNHTNAGPIIGNIQSPLFGRANQLPGGTNGEGFSENANNRRLELQLRFTY